MSDSERRAIAITVNGTPRRTEIDVRTTLADCLRQHFGLTGTHLGCEHGVCGACTVLFDGQSIRSCLMLAVQAEGHAITTIEALAEAPGKLSALQQALKDRHGVQCGFCTAGILMTLTEFLKDNPAPSEDDIKVALSGNICRCTGYQTIVAAVMDLAGKRGGAR